MAKYILNMGGHGSIYSNTVDVFKVTDNSVTKVQNHGLSLSTRRSALAAAACGNYILAMGGSPNANSVTYVVDVFKVTDNGVEAVPNHGLSLSLGRTQLAAASCGNYILAMGGDNTNTVDVFKVTTNGVEAVQNHGLALSAVRGWLAAASCGNYILAMGGSYGYNYGYSDVVDVFKVTDNGVEAVQNHGLSLSIARNHLAAASCGNYILAMGGFAGSVFVNTIDVFKVTDNGVEAVPNHGLALNEERFDLAAASCGNYILAMGGDNGIIYPNEVNVFKVTDNGVTKVQNHGLTLSEARSGLTAASCGNYILAMGGGISGNPGTYFNTVDVFQCFE